MKKICIKVSSQRGDWVCGETVWDAIECWIKARTSEIMEINNYKHMLDIGLITNLKQYVSTVRKQAILGIQNITDCHGLPVVSRRHVLLKYINEFDFWKEINKEGDKS